MIKYGRESLQILCIFGTIRGVVAKPWFERNICTPLQGVNFILGIVVLAVSKFYSKKIIVAILTMIVKRTKNTWDDYLIKRKVFTSFRILLQPWLFSLQLV